MHENYSAASSYTLAVRLGGHCWYIRAAMAMKIKQSQRRWLTLRPPRTVYYVHTDGRLILRKSRVVYFRTLVFLSIFLALFVLILLGQDFSAGTGQVVFAVAGWFVVFIIVGDYLRRLRVVLYGEVFAFERATDSFMRNAERLCPLKQIAAVQIRTIIGDPNEFRLSVVHQDGTKTRIEESTDRREMEELAEAIAEYTSVPIIHKK